MSSNDGWLTRKRKRRTTKYDAAATAAAASTSSGDANVKINNDNTAEADTTTTASATATTSNIPASLMPFLGWTKLSACHINRPRPTKKRKKANVNYDSDEPVQKVTGRAIFFIHDPHPSEGNDDDERDESKIWFQGRFFPSLPNNSNRRNTSPTSVLSPSESSIATMNNNSNSNNNSWGILAVQNVIVDECLTCSEGGYRELDLTFIRPKQQQQQQRRRWQQQTTSSSNNNEKKKKVRWVAQDVVWTGGNMMRLSSDPYYSVESLGSTTTTALSTTTNNTNKESGGVKFEPTKLMAGTTAMMDIATKYFPKMVKRLRIHDVLVTNTMDEEGICGVNDDGRKNDFSSVGSSGSDAMVLIGDMEVVAPVSFVRMGNNGTGSRVGWADAASRGGDDSDEDGLWTD